jgi:hypothetical protein
MATARRSRFTRLALANDGREAKRGEWARDEKHESREDARQPSHQNARHQ